MISHFDRRLELLLADGDGGTCQLLCPVCANSSTRVDNLEFDAQGLKIRMRNECGHCWTLNLKQNEGELQIEVR
jgi:hypothetical protein